MDETWVHHFDPETKRQSQQWKHMHSPPPVKCRKIASAGKVMASVFWDCDGVVMIEYLEKGHTVTGQYYAQQLERLKQAIMEKRPGKFSAGVLLLHDNAPAHSAKVAVAMATKCQFDLLPHPPYSPDLAPSDYYMFPQLKIDLKGCVFSTDNDVMEAVDMF